MNLRNQLTWPELRVCPACGGKERSLLHVELPYDDERTVMLYSFSCDDCDFESVPCNTIKGATIHFLRGDR
jgi:C4-type Zn-finger protein